MDIELLVVAGCPHREAAAELIESAVAATQVAATLKQTTICTQDQAERRDFTGSPTMLVNGTDPFAEPGTRVALACRLYATPDGLRGVPDGHDLRGALQRAAAR